ncbi:putative RNA methyltransferase [Saccharospirillum salsuginis]|uniref:SAM-dependent methyltransferase n=1 Tax=Saccharospirillum salsuginis TaxID=418750 RepID=A0A918N6K0_9GAMM|nr:methyltransferase domain-containing protein [Saccharospirillum salsuginis]GGX39575.1 SAM-dependent methyltransferase [Saccharospirillum salsuginis]
MPHTPFDRLACPLDSQPLTRDDNRWTCSHGHSYDIARQGYTHLLPVQHKRSRDPGDSKAMVQARKRFLNGGYYQAIATAVTQTTLKDHPSEQPLACLDAGCGEGYYLRQLAEQSPTDQPLELMGLDVSKWAVLAAAKQDSNTTWVVGTNAHLPVQSDSLDRVLCMFGFPVYSEFSRVLKPGGRLIQVDPGADHLRELRAVLYSEVRDSRSLEQSVPEGFEAVSEERIREVVSIEGQDNIQDVLSMTPHGYRAPKEGLERVAMLEEINVAVDVVIRVMEFR